MKKQKRSRVLVIILLIFVTTTTSWISGITAIDIRPVDMMKILITGILIGVLLSVIIDSFRPQPKADE